MKNTRHILAVLCGVAALPMTGFAAGTYYTGGNYVSPQYTYNSAGPAPSAYTPVASGYSTGYQPGQSYSGAYTQTNNRYSYVNPGQGQAMSRTAAQSGGGSVSQRGFFAGLGASYEMAQWQMSMKDAGSKLDYNNIGWAVFDIGAGYNFGPENYGFKIDLGLKYGLQAGTSQMVDDDISNGGFYLDTYYVDTNGNGQYDPGTDTKIGDITGNALSVGSSSGGSMFGYNIGVALADSFRLGKVSVTPTLGYRSLSYKLNTKDNYGLSIDTGYCIIVPGSDELQCDPLIIVYDGSTSSVIWDDKDTGAGEIDTGGTYYYAQPGKSHDYKVEWTGPYLAFDLDYVINQNNAVTARVEFGLPAYTSTGDQPYRVDWLHPESVKDTGSIGDAYHIGFLANWTTAISNSVAFQLGFTYDYYNVSGANAKTYLNSDYYLDLYWYVVDNNFGGDEAAAQASNDPTVHGVLDLIDECPGWVCKANNEVSSFYKSLGIRVGLTARF